MTEEALTITQLTCQRCGRKWFPTRLTLPAHCPGCNSPYWNKPKDNHDVNNVKPSKKYRLLCLRCGHDWSSDNSHPVRCAKCKSPYWDRSVNRVKEETK